MQEVYVVIDRDYKERILGLFNNEIAAKEHADDHNGLVFPRYIHSESGKQRYMK